MIPSLHTPGKSTRIFISFPVSHISINGEFISVKLLPNDKLNNLSKSDGIKLLKVRSISIGENLASIFNYWKKTYLIKFMHVSTCLSLKKVKS